MINEFSTNNSFYTCNGLTFQSKVKACVYAQTVNQPVKWIFGLDEIYSKYSWDIEPTETIDELYDRRARELREQYDYIAISYSGGADSHNVLMSFYRQGLHVDEVITNHLTSVTEKFTDLSGKNVSPENYNAEHQLNAVAKLQWIKTNMPKTLVVEVDMGEAVLNSFKPSDESWVLDQNVGLSMAHRFRTNFFRNKDFKNRLDVGKKVGFVVGIDKPKTVIDNNVLTLMFNDTMMFNSSIRDYNIDYDNVTIEPFYWASSTAPLICKQVHIIKRFIESSPGRRYYWDINKGFTYEVSRRYHERWLRTLLYTTWNDSWYQADKSKYVWHTEFDSWAKNYTKGTTTQFLWNQGLEFLTKNAKDFVAYREGKADGLKPFTVKYPICKMPAVGNI